MSISGYSLSKIKALLAAQDAALEIERARAARQAQTAADISKFASQLPGQAYGIYSGIGKAMDEEAQRKLRDAMASAEAGDIAADTTGMSAGGMTAPDDEAINEEYARIMAQPRAMQPLTAAEPAASTMVGADEMDMSEYGVKGLPYFKSFEALTGKSQQAPPEGAREIPTGGPVSPEMQFPEVDAGGTAEVGTFMPQGVSGPEEDRLKQIMQGNLKKKVDTSTGAPTSGPTYKGVPIGGMAQAVPSSDVKAGVGAITGPMSAALDKIGPSADDEDILFPTAAEKNAVPEETSDEPSAVEATKVLEPPAPTEDPDFVAQKAYLDKIQSYKPPKYVKNEKEIARDIIDQVYKQQPAGNPILNILTFGQYQNKMEQSEKIAEKMLIKEIRKERALVQDKHFKDFERQAKLEAQALRLQQQAIDSKRKADIQQQKIGIKIQKPDDALAKLNDYQETDNYLGDVVEQIAILDRKNESLPAGAAYTIKLAADFAKAATPAQQKSVGANLNAALGAMGVGGSGGGGITISVGSRTIKEDVLRQAAEQMARAKMSPTQRALASKLMLAIQVIGKAREGGRMTDADLRFYLDNLVSMDNSPRALLDSINYLRKTNARSHNMWLKSFNGIYGPAMFGNRQEMEPLFIDEEMMARFDKRPYVLPPELAALLNIGPEATLESVSREGKEALKNLPKGSAAGGTPPGYPE